LVSSAQNFDMRDLSPLFVMDGAHVRLCDCVLLSVVSQRSALHLSLSLHRPEKTGIYTLLPVDIFCISNVLFSVFFYYEELFAITIATFDYFWEVTIT